MSKIIIFDFDGTLVDSMQLMIESYNQAAHTYGCAPVQPDALKQLRSMHLRDILYLLKIPYLKLPFLVYSSLSYYRKKLSAVKIFSGIPEMLCSLKVLGFRLYIVSTNSVETIEFFLKDQDLNFFQGIYSCGSNMFGKDYLITSIIKNEHVQPHDVFYIGDELRDIEAAQKTGARMIAVSWGYNAREKLKQYKIDALVDTPDELLDFLKNNI